MSDVIIEFKLNDLSFGETTIVVTNPVKLKEKIRNLTVLKSKGHNPDDEEWYQIPNSKVYSFIKQLIQKIPYAKYSRAELLDIFRYASTFKEVSFKMSSASQKIYTEFLDLYKNLKKSP